MSLKDRFASAWNAFQTEPKRQEETLKDPPQSMVTEFSTTGYYRQDRRRIHYYIGTRETVCCRFGHIPSRE